MEAQTCEKCHHKSRDVTLKQSEEVLCNSFWSGFPPYWPSYKDDQDQSDTEQEEDNEIDQSFRFTFSTPSLLAVSNNNLPSESGSANNDNTSSETKDKDNSSSPRPNLDLSVDNTEFATGTISPSSQMPSSAGNNTACPDGNQIQETEASPSVLVQGQEKEQQEIQGNVVFADTLAKHLTKKVVGNKKQLKWNGSFNELQDFVTSVLKLEGKWKQCRVGGKQKPDQPSHLKHTFQDCKLNITVNW